MPRALPEIEVLSPEFIRVGRKVHKPSPKSTSRIVLLIGRLAIKVDNHRPAMQNRNEVEFLKTVRPQDRRYFAKIHAHADDYSWLIMRRHYFRGGKVSKAARAKIQELIDRYHLEDINLDPTPEWPNRNFGIRRNGQPVIYDYGWSSGTPIPGK